MSRSTLQPSNGWLAQFSSVPQLIVAVRRLREQGYSRLEVYSAFPVDGLAEVLKLPPSHIPACMLLGGLVGAAVMLALQYYGAVIDYPINVGGRPDAAWPAFIPGMLEISILCAALAGFIGLLAGSGLPRFHHPLFDVSTFEEATRDGLFIFVCADEPYGQTDQILSDLAALNPTGLHRVLQ